MDTFFEDFNVCNDYKICNNLLPEVVIFIEKNVSVEINVEYWNIDFIGDLLIQHLS